DGTLQLSKVISSALKTTEPNYQQTLKNTKETPHDTTSKGPALLPRHLRHVQGTLAFDYAYKIDFNLFKFLKKNPSSGSFPVNFNESWRKLMYLGYEHYP
ncbi:hypothetical protein STEG23_028084, partial [Scotinomys teguina]